jgi:hypothetical protein
MKKLLLVLTLFTSFIVNSQKIYSVNSQFDADIKVHTIESLCGLNNGNNPFDKEDFQSNFDKTPTTFTKGNSNFLSRTEENVLRLDSEVVVRLDINYKYENTYDENGNLTLRLRYARENENQSFVPTAKDEYTYDANGNTRLWLLYRWNTDSQSFVPSQKQERTYDANGNITLYIDYIWNTDSQSFVPNEKLELTYDANGNNTLRIYNNWETDSQSFVPTTKNEYTFDANGNNTLLLLYRWNTDSQSFVPFLKYEYTFDANGNQTLHISYSFDTDSQSFVPSISYVSERTYDTDGNITWYRSTRNSWDIDSQSFVPSQKQERTYDANGNITLYLFYSWGQYESYKIEYTFDYTKIIPRTKEVYYDWFPSLGVFKPNSKKEYTIILDNDTNVTLMGTISQYDTNFNQWTEVAGEEFKSYEYYTKMAALSTEALNETLFSIYPNPTSDYIHIKTTKELLSPQFELFDVLGKKVLSQPIKATEAIDVQHLKSAIYFYKINEGTTLRKSGMIIKQ